MKKTISGFTIVELLIVIVVIAILAAISVVAYTGIQARGRDSDRKAGIQTIAKALEMYYVDNGRYPNIPVDSSTVLTTGWATTADSSWSVLAAALNPYIKKFPSDPVSTPGRNILVSSTQGYNFAYFSSSSGGYCGSAVNGMYILVYRLEGSAQENTLQGNCTTSPLNPYSGASNYRVAK